MSLLPIIGSIRQSVASNGGVAGNAIGNMYNKSTWADLTDFEQGTGYSVSGGKIQVASGATYLRLPNPSRLDTSVFSVRYKLVSGTETSGGLKIGSQSSNTTVAASGYAVGNLDATNRGKASLLDGYSNTNYYSATAITVNVGDILQLDYAKNRANYIATWMNVTTGQSCSYTFTNSFIYGQPGFGPNTGKMAIIGGSAVYEIQSITYSSTLVQGGIATDGDSITDGSNAEGVANRYSELLGAHCICAGGGDKSAELLSRLNEIIAWCKPSKIYIMIGTNDIFQGVGATTWQGNINSIVNQLQAQSITVRLITPPPSNGADMSPIRTYLTTNYSSITIDNWPALSNGSTGLNASYNSGDGTHLNAAGNTALYNAIVASGK